MKLLCTQNILSWLTVSATQSATSARRGNVSGHCKSTTIKTKMETKKNLKTCKNGHQFFKSSDCPTCPICEEERKPKDSFLSNIGAPARRALERENIKTLTDLSKYSEKEILSMHGMGKSTIPKLLEMLTNEGLTFNQ
jgi:DNA-directed RNA polymerase alpha subunit